MARSGRIANVVVVTFTVIAALALVVYPVVGAIDWQLADSDDATVLVYNTTVPDEDRLQQRAVDLVLDHRKVEDILTVGAVAGGLDIGAWPDQSPDVVFLIDAYGVYLDDIPGIGRANVGLLTQPLGDPVAPDLERWVTEGTFVYAEFNVLHAPTPADVSERFQSLFGIDATGWVGRWFENLSEVSPAIRALSTGPWPEGDAGLIFVGGPVGTRTLEPQLIVLTEDELGSGVPVISGRTPDGRELVTTPMLDWFSLIETADSADVLMWLELPVEGSAAAEDLGDLGIPSRMPLLVMGDRTAYFAANMSRTSAEFPTRRISGALDVMRLLPQTDDAASFYRVTAPTMDWILANN